VGSPKHHHQHQQQPPPPQQQQQQQYQPQPPPQQVLPPQPQPTIKYEPGQSQKKRILAMAQSECGYQPQVPSQPSSSASLPHIPTKQEPVEFYPEYAGN